MFVAFLQDTRLRKCTQASNVLVQFKGGAAPHQKMALTFPEKMGRKNSESSAGM